MSHWPDYFSPHYVSLSLPSTAKCWWSLVLSSPKVKPEDCTDRPRKRSTFTLPVHSLHRSGLPPLLSAVIFVSMRPRLTSTTARLHALFFLFSFSFYMVHISRLPSFTFSFDSLNRKLVLKCPFCNLTIKTCYKINSFICNFVVCQQKWLFVTYKNVLFKK